MAHVASCGGRNREVYDASAAVWQVLDDGGRGANAHDTHTQTGELMPTLFGRPAKRVTVRRQ